MSEVGLGVCGVQGGVTVFVAGFGDAQAVAVGHVAELAEERPGEFVAEIVGATS